MLKLDRVGTKISKLRKEKGWTQMELADLMFVSFQAVSNWERGETMPDVSKLMILAELFDVSVDEILSDERSSRIILKTLNNEVVEDITIDEIEAVAPVLKAAQIEQLYQSSHLDSIESISVLAPFVSTELIDSFAEREFLKNGLNSIVSLMPFMSDGILEALVIQTYNHDVNSIVAAFPFLRLEFLEKMASENYSHRGLKGIVMMLPFLSDKTIKQYFEEVIRNGRVEELQMIAPFVEEKDIDRLFKQRFMEL